jgi:hypothetical protein
MASPQFGRTDAGLLRETCEHVTDSLQDIAMTVLPGREVGFASPATEKKFSFRRTGIELAATAGLVIALVIAATAVSIGMARAQAFGVVHHGGAPLAIAAVSLGAAVAGWGGLNALIARDSTLPPPQA